MMCFTQDLNLILKSMSSLNIKDKNQIKHVTQEWNSILHITALLVPNHQLIIMTSTVMYCKLVLKTQLKCASGVKKHASSKNKTLLVPLTLKSDIEVYSSGHSRKRKGSGSMVVVCMAKLDRCICVYVDWEFVRRFLAVC